MLIFLHWPPIPHYMTQAVSPLLYSQISTLTTPSLIYDTCCISPSLQSDFYIYHPFTFKWHKLYPPPLQSNFYIYHPLPHYMTQAVFPLLYSEISTFTTPSTLKDTSCIPPPLQSDFCIYHPFLIKWHMLYSPPLQSDFYIYHPFLIKWHMLYSLSFTVRFLHLPPLPHYMTQAVFPLLYSQISTFSTPPH